MAAPPPGIGVGRAVAKTLAAEASGHGGEDSREQALADLRRLMRDVGRFDSAWVYREVIGEEPPR